MNESPLREARDIQLIKDIFAAVTHETAYAKLAYGPYHSLHEAWAVITEEVEETEETLKSVRLWLADIWEKTRMPAGLRDDDKLSYVATCLLSRAEEMASEAVQVAATAQKLVDFLREREAHQDERS